MSDRPLQDVRSAVEASNLITALTHAEGVLNLMRKAVALLTDGGPPEHRRAMVLMQRAFQLLPEVVDAMSDESARRNLLAAVDSMVRSLTQGLERRPTDRSDGDTDVSVAGPTV